MPLSEHEQRLLSQMEQQLLADDPRFASAMRGASRRSGTGRRLIIGGLAVAAGLLLLVLAVAYKFVPLGIAAFVLMLIGAGYAFAAPKKRLRVVGSDRSRTTGTSAVRRPATSGSGSFMHRMEQRWHRRRGGHGNWS